MQPRPQSGSPWAPVDTSGFDPSAFLNYFPAFSSLGQAFGGYDIGQGWGNINTPQNLGPAYQQQAPMFSAAQIAGQQGQQRNAPSQRNTHITPLGVPSSVAGLPWAQDTPGQATPSPSSPWATDPTGQWYRAPYGSQDQLSYNTTTGAWDFSNPYAGVGDMGSGLGNPMSMDQAIQMFQSRFGQYFTPMSGSMPAPPQSVPGQAAQNPFTGGFGGMRSAQV